MDRVSAAAREIIDDEARARAEKTSKLRAQRLKREARENPPKRTGQNDRSAD